MTTRFAILSAGAESPLDARSDEPPMRIRFSTQDAILTTFVAEPAPMMELGLALASTQRADVSSPPWRQRAASALPAAARPLLQLMPPSGAGPLFLDPPVANLAAGVDIVRRTPATTVRAELARVVGGRRPIAPWLRSLADMDRGAWVDLELALRAAYDSLVAPRWEGARRSVRMDVAVSAVR